MANFPLWKAAGDGGNEEALASRFHRHREQRTVCYWRHRCARCLPERLQRTVPRRRRDRPTCRKPCTARLLMHPVQLIRSVIADISQGIVFSLIVLQIRFHVGSSLIPRSNAPISSNGGSWPRLSGAPVGEDETEIPMRSRSVRMAVHVTKQTLTHTSERDIDRDSSFEGETEKRTAL